MRFTCFLVILLISACTSPPSALAPSAAALSLPARYDATQPPVPEIASSLTRVFPSSELNALISQALKNNPDLIASAARLKEAGFTVTQSRAGLLPTLSAQGSAARAQSNSAGAGFSAGTFVVERYVASLDAQWEVDVWGRIRAGVTAATADQSAIAADYAAARQSLAAQVAQAYFSLISSTRLLKLSQRSLESFQSTNSLVKRRFENGLSTLSDLSLTKTDIEQTRAQLIARKDARDQAARRLAALLGSYPSASLKADSFPSLRRSLPAGLPSALLRSRPDIDAAYQRIRAADARVTISHAQLYPSFPLTASLGRQSATLEDLARAQFDVWSLAGNISAPIFASGSLKAAVGAANARAEAAFATYKSTVLNALRETEDAIGSQNYLAEQESAAAAALKAAKTAEDRALRQYESGLLDILSVLEIQRRSFATEEALITVRTARYQNRVALAAALGKSY